MVVPLVVQTSVVEVAEVVVLPLWSPVVAHLHPPVPVLLPVVLVEPRPVLV
jgi:hypothetical protein